MALYKGCSCAIVLVVLVSSLAFTTNSEQQQDVSPQIEELKRHFQLQIGNLLRVIEDQGQRFTSEIRVHTHEITNLRREMEGLKSQCDNKSGLKGSLSPEVVNKTAIGTDTDMAFDRVHIVQGEEEGHDKTTLAETQSHQTSGDAGNRRPVRVAGISRQHVAFYAYLNQDVTALGTNQPIKFDHVVTNLGNQYSPTTGIYRCEVPGIYVFHVHLLSEPNKLAAANLVKNGATVSYIYAGSSGTFTHGGNTAIIELATGDNIWLKSMAGTSHQGAVIDYLFSSIAGFLLYPY